MSIRQYGVNDAETVKVWGRKLWVDAIRATYFYKFMGEGADNAIMIQPELMKGAGDRVRTTLRAELTGDGVKGAATLEGNEESLATYTDDLLIDEQRHAVKVPGEDTIEAQRVPFKLREEARGALTDWWATRMEVALANQLAGNTAITDTRYTALNPAIAPSAGRIVRDNSRANDQSLVAGDELTLNLLDRAVARMKQKDANGNHRVRPITYQGKKYYIAFIHPNQVYSLRADATTAGNWFDIQKAVLTANGSMDNPIFTGALGVYNGVILHECESVPLGVHSVNGTAVADTRRGILVGAQAAVASFGQGFSPGQKGFKWKEQLEDYEKTLGVAGTLVWGAKKSQYNSKDFATMVIATYAPEP